LSGDIDRNGRVDTADLQRIGEQWHQTAILAYDADGDGRITIRDVQWVAGHVGERCS
jgi:Ca2+-binding EF-hand superfamily protein